MPDSSAEQLRQDVDLLRKELSTVTAQIDALRRRTEQIAALRGDERDAGERIARLERVLDYDAACAHVRAAVSASTLIEDPVPHLWVSDVFPHDVYAAVSDAIPPAVFFDRDAAGQSEMRVPPRLAPTYSIVTWAFVTEVVLHALSPALVDRFEQPLAGLARTRFPTLPPLSELGVEVTLSQGRLIRRHPGYQSIPSANRDWDFLTTVLCLARSGDSDDFGSRLHGRAFPFKANSALTFVAPAHAHAYDSIPETADAQVERYTYEFGTGPTQASQRLLAASGAPQARPAGLAFS